MTSVKGSTLNRGLNAADKPYYIQDLTGTDQTGALQNAINDAQLRGRDLRIPPFRIEHTGLTLPIDFSIKIDGEPNSGSITNLVNTSNAANTFTSLGAINGGILENFSIAQTDGLPLGTGTPNGSTGGGIVTNVANEIVNNFRIKNVEISGHAGGVEIANGQNCSIDIKSLGTSVLDGSSSTGIGINLIENGDDSFNISISDTTNIKNYDVGLDSFCEFLAVGNCEIIDYAAAGFKSHNTNTTYLNQVRFESQALYSPVSSILDVDKTAYIHHYRGSLGSNDSLTVDVAGIGAPGMGRYAVTLDKNSKAYLFAATGQIFTESPGDMTTAANWTTVNMDFDTAATASLDFGRDTEGVMDTAADRFTAPVDGTYQFHAQISFASVPNGGPAAFGYENQFVASLVVDGDPTVNRLMDNLFVEFREWTVFAASTPAPIYSLPLNITAFLEEGQTVELMLYWKTNSSSGPFVSTAVASRFSNGPNFDYHTGAGASTNNPPMLTFIEAIGPLD